MASPRAAVLAAVLLTLQSAAIKILAPVEPTTKITAPNVDDDHKKATKAIAKYMESSKATMEVYNDVVDTKKVAPGSYPSQIDNLIKSQKATIEVASDLKDAAKAAASQAEGESSDADSKYGAKEAALSEGRTGDNFEEEAKKLKEKLEGDRKEIEKLKHILRDRTKYQIYLDSVVEHASEDYEEVAELLNRYRTLKAAQNDLKRRAEAASKSIDSIRSELRHFTKERTTEILQRNNKLSKLRKEINHSETYRIGVQNEMNATARSSSAKTMLVEEIIMAVDNLRQRCTSKHGVRINHGTAVKKKSRGGHDGEEGKSRTEKASRTCDNLEVIMRYVLDFEKIVAGANNK